MKVLNVHERQFSVDRRAVGALVDSLVEDSLATAEASLGLTPRMRPWSLWVRMLRWAFSGGNAGPQVMPCKVFETGGPEAR